MEGRKIRPENLPVGRSMKRCGAGEVLRSIGKHGRAYHGETGVKVGLKSLTLLTIFGTGGYPVEPAKANGLIANFICGEEILGEGGKMIAVEKGIW